MENWDKDSTSKFISQNIVVPQMTITQVFWQSTTLDPLQIAFTKDYFCCKEHNYQRTYKINW
jgi:hypothetical protein